MLNSRKNPKRAYAILSCIATGCKQTEPLIDIEKLTARLNACKHRRSIYNAMLSIAPIIREARTEQQRKQLLEDLRKEAAEYDQH